MTLELTRDFLGWCTLINIGIMIFWALMFFGARGWIYRFHSRMFPMSEERFNSIHYGGDGVLQADDFCVQLGAVSGVEDSGVRGWRRMSAGGGAWVGEGNLREAVDGSEAAVTPSG